MSLQLDDLTEKVEQSLFARGGRQHGNEIVFPCVSGTHQDRHPSAEYNLEKKVWHCFACGAGGGVKDLMRKLGLSSDYGRIGFEPFKPRFDWRQFANAIQHLSDIFFLRSEQGFSAVRGFHVSEWTDADIGQATGAMAKAQYFREQSERLADFAVAYRATHLTKEQSNAHRRSKVA